jgi:glutamyl-tRNA synthetase
MSNVRVRFAPSPTGFFHIGSARTALCNWLYARHTGGTFILRIEDTDKQRNSEAFLNLIYESLSWLGLNWDEGPRAGGNGGGDFGPYRQSERAPVYKEYVDRLLGNGRAYEKDGAIWFKLLGERYEIFDEHRKKSVTKVKGAPVVIEDQIRGRVERMEDEDFVIVRSDGNPVFHLVNVVDDIAMQVTHIIRGEDHLSNTSKHVHLYAGFGATPPAFAHIPLIQKQNGPGKMSKRDQGALVEEYQRRGYLPEALVNFLCLLGWNPGDDREKLPMAEIIRLFDLPGINQSNARFDLQLRQLCGHLRTRSGHPFHLVCQRHRHPGQGRHVNGRTPRSGRGRHHPRGPAHPHAGAGARSARQPRSHGRCRHRSGTRFAEQAAFRALGTAEDEPELPDANRVLLL